MAIQKVNPVPQEKPGSVNSITGRTQNQANAIQNQYAKRLASYQGANGKFINQAYQGALSQYGNAYQRGNQSLEEFYRKFFADMKKNYNKAQNDLTQNRQTGLQGLKEDYANRGISLNSGIVQQSQNEYNQGANEAQRKSESAYRRSQQQAEQEKGDTQNKLTKDYASRRADAANRRQVQQIKRTKKGGVTGSEQIG